MAKRARRVEPTHDPMTTILDEIVAGKRREVAARTAAKPLAELMREVDRAAPVRDFRAALQTGPGLGIIAEVKKASPSAGVLRDDFDPVALARAYERGGANAISVLTDEPHFQGRLEHLSAVRAAVAP